MCFQKQLNFNYRSPWTHGKWQVKMLTLKQDYIMENRLCFKDKYISRLCYFKMWNILPGIGLNLPQDFIDY